MSRAINDGQLFEDLSFLSSTDVEAAKLKVDELRQKYIMERTEENEYLAADGTVADRKAKAKQTKKYLDQESVYLKAYEDHEVLKAQRYSAILRVEVWRSMNANRRQGNVQ